MNWTKEDMQRFVDAWEQKVQDANKPGEVGEVNREKLNNALRNIGQTYRRSQSSTAGVARDNTGRMRVRNVPAPPAGFKDRVRAYKDGISRLEGYDEIA